ncbi:MAG: amino acid--tRNA ligase-related protein [Mangrovibacterium sp.]
MSASVVPPFTIEDESDGGDDIRMKYRYLDLRRSPVRDNLILRSKIAHAVRSYLNDRDFIETETPGTDEIYLLKEPVISLYLHV